MSRERGRRGRAAERAQAERQTRLIYIGTGAVLGVALLLIVVGLYVTRYRPPRAHILTAAGESYDARDVVDRGVYLALFEGTSGGIADVARETVDRLIEEQALRTVGPEIVAPVTDDDIRQELLIDLGLTTEDVPPTATATPEPTAEATGEASQTATATPEATETPTEAPTASPTVDPQEFADALTGFLRNAGLDRDGYEAIVAARLYRERLRDHFEEELGTSGPQIRLQRIRVSTQLAAESVIEALEGGADFGTLADEQSVSDEDGAGGEIGWTALEVQDDDVQAALEGLEAGEWTAPIEAGLFFDIYFVEEQAEDRDYDAGLLSRLAAARLDAWIADATASIEVDDDLSADEETWINDHVLAELTSRLGG
jgi:hypothetical protein